MPRSRRRSPGAAVRAAGALCAAAAIALGGCASQRPAWTGPPPTPAEIYRSLLGHNAGLTSLRAVAEARLSFAGRAVSLPGVLTLDSLGGFRLDLLDPLDRPVAVFFVEGGRIVHYRPAAALAASLGVFPAECTGVNAADWVTSVLNGSLGPAAGETFADHVMWGGARVLERRRGGALYQSVRYRVEGGEALPRDFTWFCGDEPALLLRPLEWVNVAPWRLPSRIDIEYPRAGLAIRVDLSEMEANPPPSRQPLRPQLGTDVRWTSWNLPQ